MWVGMMWLCSTGLCVIGALMGVEKLKGRFGEVCLNVE